MFQVCDFRKIIKWCIFFALFAVKELTAKGEKIYAKGAKFAKEKPSRFLKTLKV